MIDLSDLLGIPFVNMGRDAKTGLDCYGLVIEVYKKFGIALPESYECDFDDTTCINAMMQECKKNTAVWQRIPEPVVPSIVAIRYGVPAPLINHVGVYIGDGYMIHTRNKTGSVIESIYSPLYEKVIEGLYVYRSNEKR